MPSARHLRILLVDDEPDILLLLQTMLRAANWEVVGRATSGEDALRVGQHIVPDVAIVDFSMPGMNGLELSTRLKALHPGASVVIFSAHAVDAAELAAAGADDYLNKTDVDQLLPLLASIAEKRGLA